MESPPAVSVSDLACFDGEEAPVGDCDTASLQLALHTLTVGLVSDSEGEGTGRALIWTSHSQAGGLLLRRAGGEAAVLPPVGDDLPGGVDGGGAPGGRGVTVGALVVLHILHISVSNQVINN